ncbi:MAG TPA: ATP-binding protein [Polyangiaceae bacterium]|nr:ATP-binding protein [Polyangiaceae bacterium]
MACGRPGDGSWCALVARRFALRHGLSKAGAGQVALAVAELVSNVARHGGGRGRLVLRTLEPPLRGVEVVVCDNGPGIANPELALQDGWSRGGPRTPDSPRDGLGTGLGAVRRAMDEFRIDPRFEGGTRITARKFVDRNASLRRHSDCG